MIRMGRTDRERSLPICAISQIFHDLPICVISQIFHDLPICAIVRPVQAVQAVPPDLCDQSDLP